MSARPTMRDRARRGIAQVEALGDRQHRLFTAFDATRILAEAEALDLRHREASDAMPLYGLSISIKDLFDEAGQRTTAGSRLLQDRAPADTDATVIAALREAGALCFGRTTMSEFAYSGVGLNPHYGTPGSVFDTNLIPGGSTSGGAITVALGLCDAALGTDTGGSVRIPAAVNGLYGYKPSQPAISRTGVHPLSESYDSVGPLTRDYDALLALWRVLRDTGDAELLPAADELAERPLRLAVAVGAFEREADPSIIERFEGARRRLTSAGHHLTAIDMSFLPDAARANPLIVSSEAHAQYAAHFDRLETIGDQRVLDRIRAARDFDDEQVEAARETRADAIDQFARRLEGFDALLAPTLAIEVPTIAAVEDDFVRLNAAMLRHGSFINLVDGCALSLPTAPAPGHALMIAAPRLHDETVLAIGQRVRELFAA